MKPSRRFFPVFAAVAFVAASTVVFAQQEFPPSQGKGPVVVVASGLSGMSHYVKVSRDISALGYDVVLFDGEAMEHTQGQAVHVGNSAGAADAPRTPGQGGSRGILGRRRRSYVLRIAMARSRGGNYRVVPG